MELPFETEQFMLGVLANKFRATTLMVEEIDERYLNRASWRFVKRLSI
jgi:hypothetical protein